MQIITNKRSQYVNFNLIPTEGFVISHHLIDFESKLLIVAKNIIEDSKIRNVPIPCYTSVSNPKCLTIHNKTFLHRFYPYSYKNRQDDGKKPKNIDHNCYGSTKRIKKTKRPTILPTIIWLDKGVSGMFCRKKFFFIRSNYPFIKLQFIQTI